MVDKIRNPNMIVAIFEQAHAIAINESRQEFLKKFLPVPEVIRINSLQSALDIGCSYGLFSRYLDLDTAAKINVPNHDH